MTLERKDLEFQVNFCSKEFPFIEKTNEGKIPFIQITQGVLGGSQTQPRF